MKRFLSLLLLAAIAAPTVSADPRRTDQSGGVHGTGIDASTLKDALHAFDLGLAWLAEHQGPVGSWSQPEYPALTALSVLAVLSDPRRQFGDTIPEPARRGLDYLMRCVRPDGGIYIASEKMPSLPHYNTSLALTALAFSGDPDFRGVCENARAFLVKGQHFGSDIYNGGFGYDTESKRAYADLSGTYMVLEAMKLSETVRVSDETAGASPAQLDWGAALTFLGRVQNLPEVNDRPWAKEATPDDLGGFVYHPDESKAGDEPSTDESRRLHSYGSMSYAGLLSLIYAEVDSSDIRVRAAVDWLRRHYSVDENPGMGAQGLYYNYHTMAKALNVWGENPFRIAGGREVWWRRDLAAKLVALQRVDPATNSGYWVNDNGRWWENDPTLSTAFALVALGITIRPAVGT